MIINMESKTLNSFLVDSIHENNTDVKDVSLLNSIANELFNRYKIADRKDSKTDKAYLFIYNSIIDFKFKQFNSIEEIIKEAVNYIENVKIIYKGRVIKWDILNEGKAFYIDPFSDKIYTVNLGGTLSENEDTYGWVSYNN